ncbi:MAG: DedA family protein [Gemmatimonadaceae bacterium]
MDWLTGWLGGVPVGALYALIFSASFLEGLLPIVPGDVAAALLAFYAARAGGDLAPTIAAVTVGSVLGALIMWWVGRRYGANYVAKLLHRLGLTKAERQVEDAEHRVEAAYWQYGWVALFLSRFLPGLRAVVPAAAGALRIPLWVSSRSRRPSGRAASRG